MIDRRLLTQGIVDHLANGTEKWAGITAPAEKVFPYVVVYPIAGSRVADDMANSHRQWRCPYQFTSTGQNYAQAEAMADLVRTVFLDFETYPMDEIGTMTVTLRESDGGPMAPDYFGAELVSVAERFSLHVDAP